MKFRNLLMISAAVLTLSACSDEDKAVDTAAPMSDMSATGTDFGTGAPVNGVVPGF